MSAPHFVRKIKLDDQEPVRVGGRLAMEDHAALQEAVAERCGRDTANLFAEPVITRGNGAAPSSISWYAATPGEPVPLRSLDAEARQGPEEALKRHLQTLRPALDDPEIGPLVRSSLYVASPDDILVLNGKPLLTNWGLLPHGVLGSDDARRRHFDATLGPYAPFDAPPLQPGSAVTPRNARGSAVAAGAAAAGAAALGTAATASGAQAAGPTGAAGGAGGVVPAPPTGGAGLPPGGSGGGMVVVEERQRPWLGVLIAVIVSALVLVFLLLPGVLLHPPQPGAEEPRDFDREIALQRDINRALEEQIRNTELALEQGVCRAEDAVLVLPGMPGHPMTPAPGETGQLPQTIIPPSVLPPEPANIMPPTAALPPGQSFEGTLVDLLDAATVLVVAAGGQSADELGIGSGFFIAPQTVITNLHVLEPHDLNQIYVTNEALGEVQRAQLIHQTESSRIGSSDYAVLHVPGATDVPYLALTPTVGRLQNVVAAGFPTIILEVDLSFQALISGDRRAIPEMALTQGVVTVVQNVERSTPIVAHTATISPGNSGGPLVDSCGRVVGVNTFLLYDEERAGSRVNYAIAVHDLMQFLDTIGVGYSVVEGACAPQRVAQAPASPDDPAEAEAEAETEAEEGGAQAPEPADEEAADPGAE